MRVEVVLSADIEFDINGALTFPDRRTPAGTECVYRRDGEHDQGLMFILETLDRHALPGSFFLETLGARYFGVEKITELATVITRSGRHELELHLHPEWRYFNGDDWRDELTVARANGWRPSGSVADCSEQLYGEILDEACATFELAAGRRPRLFRSGGLSAVEFMYPLLAQRGIVASSSVGLAYNPSNDVSLHLCHGQAVIEGLLEFPVTSFADLAVGRWRHLRLLTITGCTFSEIRGVLECASRLQQGPVVVLTHASEFSVAVPNGSGGTDYRANPVTMKRLERLCGFLAENSDRFEVTTLSHCTENSSGRQAGVKPFQVGPWALLKRWLDNQSVQRIATG